MTSVVPHTDFGRGRISTPFCADDQWIDRDILFRYGARWRQHATARALIEFKRSLLSCKTIALNRSFLVNGDFLHALRSEAADRLGLNAMFADGSVLGILHGEEGPELDEAEADGVLNSGRRNAWRATYEEAPVRFVRLGETPPGAPTMESTFGRRLDHFLATGADKIVRLAERDGAEERTRFAEYLPTASEAVDRIRQKTGGRLTRSAIYKALIIEPDSALSDTVIDLKPGLFARELKQVIDLIYNTSASDAFGFRPFLSTGMLDRTVLGEPVPDAPPLTAREIVELVVATHFQFAKVIDRQEILIENLSLQQIQMIRMSNAWRQYNDASALVSEPFGRLHGHDLVDEVSSRLNRIEVASARLCDHIRQYHGDAYVARPKGVARVLQFGLMLGGNVLGGMVGDGAQSLVLLGSIGAIAGGAAGLGVSTLAGPLIERVGGLAIGMAKGGLEAAKLPPFSFGDPQESVGTILRLLSDDHGLNLRAVDRVREDMPGDTFIKENETG